MKIKRILTLLLIILLLFSIVVIGAPTYINLGPTSNIEGDIGVPSGSGYYIGDVLFSSLVKWNATSAPTVNDDIDLGYTVGSRWIDITNDKEYICLDNTDGAAVWTETTGAGGGATTFLALTDTPANYTGSAGKYAKVNAGETALEFGTPAGGGDVLGPATSVDNTIARFNGTDNKTIDDSLATIDDNGSVNIPAGQSYKINNTALAVGDITGAATTAGKLSQFAATTSAELAGVISDETGTGALVFANSPVIDFYNALGSDHLYSGDIDSEPVGETVAFGQLLYFNWTDKEWKIADADTSTTMPGLRIALEAKNDGETCKLLVKGYIRDDSAFEFAGAMVYASQTAGGLTSTAPSAIGNQVQRVGQAKFADILFFAPSIDVGEI